MYMKLNKTENTDFFLLFVKGSQIVILNGDRIIHRINHLNKIKHQDLAENCSTQSHSFVPFRCRGTSRTFRVGWYTVKYES